MWRDPLLGTVRCSRYGQAMHDSEGFCWGRGNAGASHVFGQHISCSCLISTHVDCNEYSRILIQLFGALGKHWLLREPFYPPPWLLVCHLEPSFRAEGALSMTAPEDVVEIGLYCIPTDHCGARCARRSCLTHQERLTRELGLAPAPGKHSVAAEHPGS